LRAAHDDRRGVNFAAATRNAEMREFVSEDLTEAGPPVRKNPDAGFEAEVDGVDDCAVGASAGDTKKIFFLFRLLERNSEAEGDFFHFAVNEFLCGHGNVPGEVEFLGEDVGGAAGKKGERDAVAIVMSGEAVDDFVERAIATTGDNQAAVFFGGPRGDFDGVAGAGGFGEFSVNATRGENVARLVEQPAACVATAIAGVGVVDHQCVLEVSRHSGSRSCPLVSQKHSFYIISADFAHRILGGVRERRTRFLAAVAVPPGHWMMKRDEQERGTRVHGEGGGSECEKRD